MERNDSDSGWAVARMLLRTFWDTDEARRIAYRNASAAIAMHDAPDGSEVMAPFPSADPLPGEQP